MRLVQPLVNLLYPPACLRCHRRLRLSSDVLCAPCEAALPPSPRPRCARCGVGVPGAFDAVPTCASCRMRPPVFEAARSPWPYIGTAREIIRLFKYRHRWRLGRRLAQEMADVASHTLPVEAIDIVLPVPLHWLKRTVRGADPVAELAGAVAAMLRKPCEPSALRRRRWTSTQTALTWRGRWRNVRGAFAANPRRVRGRSVLLIDDVLTSGATAQACSHALRTAGARRVFVLTAARTHLRRDLRGEGRQNRPRRTTSLAPSPLPPAPTR